MYIYIINIYYVKHLSYLTYTVTKNRQWPTIIYTLEKRKTVKMNDKRKKTRKKN